MTARRPAHERRRGSDLMPSLSVSKLKNGTYRARYRDPSGKQHARHFALKKAAEAWLDTVRVDLANGVHVDPKLGKVTFQAWSKQWKAEAVHLKPKTLAGYESILNKHLLPKWEHARLADIDRP